MEPYKKAIRSTLFETTQIVLGILFASMGKSVFITERLS